VSSSGGCRILHKELPDLYRSPDAGTYGNEMRPETLQNCAAKSSGKVITNRTKEVEGYVDRNQDRVKWWVLVCAVLNLQVLQAES